MSHIAVRASIAVALACALCNVSGTAQAVSMPDTYPIALRTDVPRLADKQRLAMDRDLMWSR